MITKTCHLTRCRFLVAAILLAFVEAQTAVAASITDALSLQQRFAGSSEYRAGNLPDSLLVPVRLLGAVPKAGVHYIPKRTDLVTLLSYAGGLLPSAEGYLVIKRRVGNEFKNYRLNLDRLADADENSIPLMQEDDLVYIPFFRPVVHPDTMQMISVVATVLSIAVSATVLISRFQ
ncbi:MAG: hypothetical protein R3B54_03620 [Bdellovibrionota bacterium]